MGLTGAKYLNRLAPAVRRARKKAQLHDVKLLKQGREVSSIAEISEPSLALLSPCRAGRHIGRSCLDLAARHAVLDEKARPSCEDARARAHKSAPF